MKLAKAQITNYRCVDDSGEFSLNQTTCLVGKNESGKTTLLRDRTGPGTPCKGSGDH
jgi:predicted ATP-dependent endonuclease of OLD family